MTKKEMLEKVERRRRYYGLTREQVVFAIKLTGRQKRYAKRSRMQVMKASYAYKKFLSKKYGDPVSNRFTEFMTKGEV